MPHRGQSGKERQRPGALPLFEPQVVVKIDHPVYACYISATASFTVRSEKTGCDHELPLPA
jgi:hypothetical protein